MGRKSDKSTDEASSSGVKPEQKVVHATKKSHPGIVNVTKEFLGKGFEIIGANPAPSSTKHSQDDEEKQ